MIFYYTRSVAPVSCVGEKRAAHLGGRARAPPRITRPLLIDQHSAALAYTHTHKQTNVYNEYTIHMCVREYIPSYSVLLASNLMHRVIRL